MIKINFDKYGKIRNLDFGDEVIFKGNNRVNQIFVAFDDVSYNPNHYMTYSALINENDYEGNLTDLATAKTTIDGVEGYTFYLFSNLTAKAGELKLSVRLVDRTTERVLVSGIIPLVIEDTAISTYASVDITKTQYNALLTAFDELSQSIDATNFKTINGESIYGEGDIVVLTSDVMVYYVGQQISDVNDSLWNLSQRINDVETENAELNALIEKQEKKIKQLELASEGNILSTITESDSAYEVNVGVDTLPNVSIDKIGGMTYKSINLLALDDVTSTTKNGITYKVENGVITLSGTATANVFINLTPKNTNIKGQHTFGVFEKLPVGVDLYFQDTTSNYGATIRIQANTTTLMKTYNYSTFANLLVSIQNGSTISNCVIKPIIVTGTTAPSSWQQHFDGLRDNKVTEIINHGANILNLNDIAETTKNGVAYKVKDGIITLNGKNSASSTTWLEIPVNITLNGNYSINWFQEGTSSAVVYYRFQNKTGTRFLGYQESKENVSINDIMTIISIPVNANATLTDYKLKPMLVKGSTAPTTFKPYKQPTAIAIPTAIQNLDGYGLGVDATYYNYVDYENKKFVKQVATLYLKNLSWSKSSVTTIDRFKAQLPSEYISINGVKTITNMEGITSSNGFDGTTQNIMAINAGTEILIQLGAYGTTTLADFTARLNQENPIVIIPLATPIAEGLSHIIDGEILTEVESGGALTFENEYKQDVPFTWTFQEKL